MALRQWSSEIYTAEFRELQASTFCCSRDGRLGLLAGICYISFLNTDLFLRVLYTKAGRLGLLAGIKSSRQVSVLLAYFYPKIIPTTSPKWVVMPFPPAFVLISSLKPNPLFCCEILPMLSSPEFNPQYTQRHI